MTQMEHHNVLDDENTDEHHPNKVAKVSKKELMNKYEEFTKTLKDQNSEASKGAASDIVITHLNSLHQLYDSIQREKNRDTKIHLKDSEAFKETSLFAATNARNIKLDDIGIAINPSDFESKLKDYFAANISDMYNNEENEQAFNSGSITREDKFNSHNWLKLGLLYQKTSKKAVNMDFMYGPLAVEKKRVIRSRTIDDTNKSGISARADEVSAREIAINDTQNTAFMVRMVYQTFIQKSPGRGMNFFKFFINPHSFAQSIENLFFTSFLIKDAKLKLYLDDQGTPYIDQVGVEEQQNVQLQSSKYENHHHIATISFSTWQRLVERYEITDSFIEHRDEVEDFIDSNDIISNE